MGDYSTRIKQINETVQKIPGHRLARNNAIKRLELAYERFIEGDMDRIQFAAMGEEKAKIEVQSEKIQDHIKSLEEIEGEIAAMPEFTGADKTAQKERMEKLHEQLQFMIEQDTYWTSQLIQCEEACKEREQTSLQKMKWKWQEVKDSRSNTTQKG